MELAEAARIVYMQGGTSAKSRAGAIFATQGYRQPDRGKSLWICYLRKTGTLVCAANFDTICRPCVRLYDARRSEYKKMPKVKAQAATLDLFEDSEQYDLKRPEGYSS